ncbi:hypothetical protein [Alteromonas sp. BMJM2]|uniref:hypothetical protein n=1 Tax=Alteromonas sp. BMJM2 TaxID=2954241 RepID=UPI0022B44DC5|nr:hypothetical protein [Alteromonas sp. BMJM2]
MSNKLGADKTQLKMSRIQQRVDQITGFEAFSQKVDTDAEAGRLRQQARAEEELRKAAISRNSWTRNADLGSVSGQGKQLANRLAQGGLQQLSELVASANNNEANRLLGKLDDRALALMQKQIAGKQLSPEDNQYLDTTVDTSQFHLPKFGTSIHAQESSDSYRNIFNEAIRNLDQAKSIDKALTQDTAVAKGFNPLNREELSKDIDKVWDESGIEEAETFTEKAKAGFSLAFGGAGSLLSNPAAAGEYAAESAAGAASTIVPGMAAINSVNYANDVRSNTIDDKLRDEEVTLTKADIEEANQEGAIAGAMDVAGDVVTARAAGLIKGIKGKKATDTPKKKSKSRTAVTESVKRPAKVLGGSTIEAGTEGVQSSIEEDAFGEDFDLKEDGKNVFESAVAGFGASAAITGSGQAAKTAVDVTKSTNEAVIEAGKAAKTRNQENAEAATKEIKSTEQAVKVAAETNDYSDIVRSSTAAVDKSEQLDIEKVASTISRQFAEQSKDESTDSEESTSPMEQIDGLWNETISRLETVMEQEDKASAKDKPALQEESSKLGDALDVIKSHRDKMSATVAKENNTQEAVKNVTNATERSEDFELNAQRIFETDSVSPDSITVDQMESLLKSDKWTPEERTRLENSFASKKAMEVITNSDDVHKSSPNAELTSKDIFSGRDKGTYGKNDKGAFGVKSYRQRVGQALHSGNMEAAQKSRDYLAAFASKHRKKADAIKLALNAFDRVGKDGNFKLQYNEAEQSAVDYLAEEHKFEMRGGAKRLAPSIEREAEALESVLVEVDGLIQAKRDTAPVQDTAETSTETPTSTPTESETATANADATPTPPPTDTTRDVENTTRPPEGVVTDTEETDDTIEPATETTQPETQTEADTQTETVTETPTDNESVSEATTDEEVETDTNLDEVLTLARNEVTVKEREVKDLQAELANKEAITNEVVASLGLADKKDMSIEERAQVNQGIRERQGEILTQLENTREDRRIAKEEVKALEGRVKDYDGTAEAFEDETFAKNFIPNGNKSLIRAIPNLLKQLKRAPSTVLAYTKGIAKLEPKQKKAVQHFTDFAEKFHDHIDAIMPEANPKFQMYHALTQGNSLEALKNAISVGAYTWLATDAKGSRYSDAQVLSKRFGIKDSDKVPGSLVGELSQDGLPINMFYRNIGGNIASALGIQLNEDTASTREQSVLELQLGELALAALSDMGMVEVRQRSMSGVIAAGNTEVRDNVYRQAGLTEQALDNMSPDEIEAKVSKLAYTTVVVPHDAEMGPFDNEGLTPELQDLISANEDTGYIVEELFGTQSQVREPMLKPGDGIEEGALMQRSIKTVPSGTRDMTAEQEKKELVIAEDTNRLMSLLDSSEDKDNGSEIEQVLGIESENRLNSMPKRMRDSARAKGNGLINEWNKFTDWRDKLSLMERGLKTPFYLGMKVIRFGRFNYQGAINPQTSKVQRALLKMKSWNEAVSVNDGPKMNAFLMGVAQGLNIDIDKQTKEESLEAMAPMVSDETNVFFKGAQAINDLLANDDAWSTTPEGAAARENLIDAVKEGKHNTHSLHALTNLARYLDAESKGQEYFEADIWLEIDGITNGVVIGSIIFGNGSADNLKEELEAGGIFFNEKRDYGEHINTKESYVDPADGKTKQKRVNKDFYERQAKIWEEYLFNEVVAAKKKPNSISSKRLQASILFFTGLDVFSGSAVEISRKMAKSPLMQNVYGAGKKSLSNDLADAIIDNFDTWIDKSINYTPKKEGAPNPSDKQKVARVNKMLKDIEPLLTFKGKQFQLFKDVDQFKTIEQIREADYSLKGLSVLQKNVKNDFAEPMLDAIEKHFQAFKFNRSVYIDNMQNQSDVFVQLYTASVKKKHAELVEEGVIATDDELPETYRKAITDELHHIMPSVENPNGDGTYETDLQAIKLEQTAAKTAKGNDFKANITLGKPLNVRVKNNDGSYRQGQMKGLSSPATVTSFSSYLGPGVGVQNIHGHDAGVIQSVVKEHDVFNVHDGIPVGLRDFASTGITANEAFFNNVFNSNPFSYAKDLIDRTVDEVNERVERGEITRDVGQRMITTLTKNVTFMGDNPKRDGGNDYEYLVKKSRETSDRLTELRDTVQYVGQYYLPGTGFVTDLGKQVDEGTAKTKASKPTQLSKTNTVKTTSTAQRAKEMEQKNLVEGESPTTQAKPEPDTFGSLLEKSLLSGDSFKTAFAKATKGMKGYHISLVNKLIGYLPDDFEVQVINSDSDPKIVRDMNGMRGAHVVGTGRLLLKGNDFKHNSMNLETVAHELLHAVSANTIDAVNNNDENVSENGRKAVEKLESLLQELRSKITDERFLPALENSKELLAWGLTNKEFIAKLKKTSVKGRINGKLVDAFTSFSSALKGFFGGGTELRNDNAMKQLIELSAAVFEEDAKLQPRSHTPEVDLNAQRIQEMSPKELLDGLANHGEVSAEHKEHLSTVQESIVNTFAGPMGADLKLEEEGQGDEIDQYLTHLSNGTRPFVSKIQGVFSLTPQEAYVAEQLEAVLDSNILNAGFAKNRMIKLWESARKSLTWESFLPSQLAKDSEAEVAKAKAKYDYLFNTSNLNKGSKYFDEFAGKEVDNRASDFLMRFAAASAVSSEVREVLNNIDEVAPENDGSFLSRLNAAVLSLLGKMEELVNGNLRLGLNIKEKQDKVLSRMAQTNHKNRRKLNRLEQMSLDLKTKTNSVLSASIKSALSGEFAKARTESDNVFIAASANIAVLAGTNSANQLAELTRRIFKKKKDDTPSAINDLVTEVMGRGHKAMDSIIGLTRKANRDVEQQRQFGKQGMIALLNSKFGGDKERLKDEDGKKLHKALLNTDAAYLLESGYNINDIDTFLSDESALASEVRDIESRLSGFSHSTLYKNQAKALAYYMVTGNATSDILGKNAKQIVNLFGLNMKVSDDRKDEAEALIDTLTSLYAIQRSSKHDKDRSSELIRTENQKDENGIEFMLRQANEVKQLALDANFDGDVIQMTKGYTPETVNPHISHEYALPNSEKAERLLKQGYRQVASVGRDRRLDSSPGLVLFSIEDGGMARRVTGSMNFATGVMSGTDFMDSMENAEQPIKYKDRVKMLRNMEQTARKNALARLSNPDFDPAKVASDAGAMMIPTFHNDGSIKTFRYEMSEALREKSLEKRYHAFEALGTMEGNVVDKRNTKDRNRDVVDTLLEQYENDVNKAESDYVFIKADAASDKLKEYWNLLPYDTQEYIAEKSGGRKLPIKRELLHVTMGFRKKSITDVLRDNPETQGYVTSLVRKGLESTLNTEQISKLIRGLKRGEDFFQAATSIIKDNVVVKIGWTTVFNIVSNFVHLLGNDIPSRQAFGGSIRGYREAAKYNKLRERSFEVEKEMALLNPGTDKHDKLLNEANKLQTMMSSSPVHKLMDAGLFQTIVEDIDNSVDPFSFKNKTSKKIDEWTSERRIGPLNKLGRYLYVTQDTQLYKMMNQPIQLSDFAARFAMYEYLTEIAPEKMDANSALETVSEHFVNYDIPTSPALQWLNDHGLLMFSKYYLRILRPVLSTFMDKPASTILSLMMTTGNSLTSPVETILGTSVFDKITNPISSGLDAWDEPIPLQAIRSVL